MTFALPFAAGGFHGYTTAFCGIFISVCLIRLAQKQRYLTIYLNLSFVAVFTVFFASCVTPFWAADKGMALFGVLRWIPAFI